MTDYFSANVFDIKSLLICLLAFFILSWWLRRPRNLPPGPWGWPLVGYLPNILISLYRTGLHPHHLLSNLAQKHGSVFSMYIGTKLVVVLNKYECIKEGFQNPLLNDRPKPVLRRHVGHGEGLGQASGEAWKQQRRFTVSTLRSFGVGKKSFEASILEESNALRKEILTLKDNPFDPCYLFANASANTICSVVFGNRFDYEDYNFRYLVDIIHQSTKLMGSGGLVLYHPLAKYLQPSIYKALKENLTNLMTFITDKINEHMSVHDSENPIDYIDVYLNEIELGKKSGTESYVNSKNLKTTIDSLFLAGLETTSTTLRWAVKYMMAYPDIQDRVQKEIDSVVGRNRPPTLADKKELPFSSATLLEIQRVASVGPLGVPHACGEDTTLDGYTIPKGSVVISNLWAVHHDPNVWQDPFEFNPERFLDEDGYLQEREYLIPFSAGHRICPGEHLAKMELFIFFTRLLHQFTFKKPDDSPPLSLKADVGFAYSTGPFLTRAMKRD